MLITNPYACRNEWEFKQHSLNRGARARSKENQKTKNKKKKNQPAGLIKGRIKEGEKNQ